MLPMDLWAVGATTQAGFLFAGLLLGHMRRSLAQDGEFESPLRRPSLLPCGPRATAVSDHTGDRHRGK